MRLASSVPAALCLAVLGGCGGSEPTPEQQVRSVLTTFARATEKRDYATICDDVFAPRLLSGLQKIGLPCEVAMRESLGRVERPRLTVGRIDVQGARATAEVRTSAEGQPPSSDVVRLDRIEGDWKVSALGGGDRPAAAGTPSPAAEGGR